jgi:hypothetical protein
MLDQPGAMIRRRILELYARIMNTARKSGNISLPAMIYTRRMLMTGQQF